MPQLPLFGEVPQVQPTARSQPQLKPRSKRIPSNSKQIALHQAIAPIARLPQRPIAPPAPAAEAIAPAPAKFDPTADPNFDPVKHCRLCGKPFKHGGLDHSLCSGDCSWVIDLQWLAWMEANRRKRKEPEPQAASHTTESNESETLDLFTYGLEGGEA